MAAHEVAGVAVWAHTGRGPHLSADQRAVVLAAWRAALPAGVVVAGVSSPALARDARLGGADAVLAFPRADDPVAYHEALGRELPVIAFYLYGAAGGVAYDDDTLRRILALPAVAGIKVATLDAVPTFQRIAAVVRDYPDKLLVTGEDRFLASSIRMGAEAALVGIGAALPDLQVELLRAFRDGAWAAFARLASLLDAFGAATFADPVEGYVRRMLWAAAAEGTIPDDACDDPWGPPLDPRERDAIGALVRSARADARSGR
jgi:4-hydroxy-tetrahydrodipicolinate synthase